MRTPKRYDAGHLYAVHSGPKTHWLGDPARGEFLPKDKKKQAKRGKRRG